MAQYWLATTLDFLHCKPMPRKRTVMKIQVKVRLGETLRLGIGYQFHEISLPFSVWDWEIQFRILFSFQFGIDPGKCNFEYFFRFNLASTLGNAISNTFLVSIWHRPWEMQFRCLFFFSGVWGPWKCNFRCFFFNFGFLGPGKCNFGDLLLSVKPIDLNCSSHRYIEIHIHNAIKVDSSQTNVRLLDTGGKPSTRFSPRELVELKASK